MMTYLQVGSAILKFNKHFQKTVTNKVRLSKNVNLTKNL